MACKAKQGYHREFLHWPLEVVGRRDFPELDYCSLEVRKQFPKGMGPLNWDDSCCLHDCYC